MDKRIVKTLNHIEAHLSEVLSLEELASIACLSPSQFHRLFKRETGNTPFRFSQKIKLLSAYQSITLEDTNVLDLSIQLGYKDYETFSRAFKKHYHLAPGDMKAIVDKLKTKIQATDKFIIATFDETDFTGMDINKLIEMSKSHNLTNDDLQQAQIYTISKKGEKAQPENTIKNKFEMVKGQKNWQQLISKVN